MKTVNLQKHDPPPILFYDGECGLCARVVQWGLRHDRRGLLRFAPLQGQTYAAVADTTKPTDLETVVLIDELGLHVRGNAILRMFHWAGGPWRALSVILRIFPRPARDFGYRFVAKRRIAWFGTADHCDLPRPEDRPRFLP